MRSFLILILICFNVIARADFVDYIIIEKNNVELFDFNRYSLAENDTLFLKEYTPKDILTIALHTDWGAESYAYLEIFDSKNTLIAKPEIRAGLFKYVLVKDILAEPLRFKISFDASMINKEFPPWEFYIALDE